nr:hypothetical protein [Tanacetum cinerariifolium]
MKLNWDGPHMPLLEPMLVVPTGGDGADAVAAGAAAAHDVPPPPPSPIVPPTHSSSSTPGTSFAPQAIHVREPTPVRKPTPMKEPTPSPVREPTPFREPTSDSPRPPSPPSYPRSEEVGTTTSTRPPSPTRQTSFQEDVTAGGAEDSAALTALSLKLDRCINRFTSLENELDITKKVLGGEDATTTEQDIDLDALHKLGSTSLGGDSTVEAAYTIYKASQYAHASSDASHDAAKVSEDTTMPFRRTSTTGRHLRNPFTSSAFEHVPEIIFAVEDTLPSGEGILAAATTIPAGSSIDTAVQAAAAAAPSSTIPAANKGKAPMDTNDSFPIDFSSEQERILKNLHDYQLGEDLAKKLHAEQEAEFARQQEELAQKAHAESVASPAEQGTGLSNQRRRELDATQLIYTEADWLELMTKIGTNSALSKQLLGDDVNKENMNERLGMLLMRKRWELAEQSQVKPMNKTQQRDFMRDFVKNQSALVYNQGWTMKQVPDSVPAVPSVAADVSVHAVPPDPTIDSAHVNTEVHADESNPDDTPTASEQVFVEHNVASSTPSSSRTRRKHLAKKRVTPIVDIDDDALTKFDSTSDSDDDPLPYAPYAGWEMVPSLLGAVDNLYQREEPDTFTLLLWGDLHVLFQSLDDEDAHDFWRNQDSCAATLQRMLKHRLEVPKLLVGGDLTMAEQLGDVMIPPKDKLAPEYVVPADRLRSHSCCWSSAGKHSFCCRIRGTGTRGVGRVVWKRFGEVRVYWKWPEDERCTVEFWQEKELWVVRLGWEFGTCTVLVLGV